MAACQTRKLVLPKPILLFVITLISTVSIGCGNDKELGTELTSLGATILNHPGKDGIPATVILTNMKGEEVDLAQALPLVAKLTQAKSLILNGTNVTDDQLAMVGKVSSLVDLQLTDTGVTDAGVAHLVGLPKLGSLYLSGTKVTGSSLSNIAKIQSLTGLAIDRTAVSGGYDSLQALPDLVLLVAGELTITEKDAKDIAKIPKLKTLYVNSMRLEGGAKGILESSVDQVTFEANAGSEPQK